MKKEEKIEIKKLVLNIKGKEVSLSLDEVKQLRTVLNEMVEKEYVSSPTYPTWQPYQTFPDNLPIQKFWYSTTCGENLTLSAVGTN